MSACVRQQNNLRFANEARVVVDGFRREIADDHNFSLRLASLRRGVGFVADDKLFPLSAISCTINLLFFFFFELRFVAEKSRSSLGTNRL